MGRTPAPWEKGAKSSSGEKKFKGIGKFLRPITNVTEDIDNAVLNVPGAKPALKGAAKGGLKLLTVADKPSQAAKSMLANGGVTPLGLYHGARGLIGKEHTTATELVNKFSPVEIKKLPFGVSTAIDTVVDPTTYVGLGSGTLAKVGLKEVAKTAGKQAAENVVKSGLKKALSSVEQQAVRASIRRQAVVEAGKSLEEAGKIADRTMRALEKSGRGGITFAGRSVPGLTAESAVGKAGQFANPKTRINQLLMASEGGRAVKGAVVRGVEAERAFGKEMKDTVLGRIKLAETRTGARQATTDAAARNVAEAAELTPERLRTALEATDVPSGNRALQGLKEGAAAAEKTAKTAGKATAKGEASLADLAKAEKVAQEARLGKTEAARIAMEHEHGAIKAANLKAVENAQMRSTMARIVYQTSGSPVAKKAWEAARKEHEKLAEAYQKTIVKQGDTARQAAEKAAVKEQEAQAKSSAKLLHAHLTQVLKTGEHKAAEGKAAKAAQAVTDNGNTKTAMADLAEQGDHGLLDVVDLINKERTRTTNEQVAKGILPAKAVHTTEEYVPLYPTEIGKKALRDRADEVAVALSSPTKKVTGGDLKNALEQGGHLNPRKLRPDLNTAEKNAMLEKAGLVKPGEKFFEDNPLLSTVRRSHQADAAVEQMTLLEDLSKIKDPRTGKPLVHEITKGKGSKIPQGHEIVDMSEQVGRQWSAHPEIKKLLDESKRTIESDRSIELFQNKWRTVMTTWRGLATLGPAFHARNEAGNVWLNWLRGIKSPAPYKEAARYQHALSTALKSLGPDADLATALKEAGLSAKETRVINGAIERGVIDRGFFLSDLPEGTGAAKALAGEKPSLGRRIGITGDNPAIKANRAVGSAVENNARMAHYLYVLKETGSPSAAADSVKKYLFDYSDLTPFEKRLKGNLVPFYTFMRKNLPLEVEALIKTPRKLSIPAHLINDARDHGVTQLPDIPVNSADDTFRILTGAPSGPNDKTDSSVGRRFQALVGPTAPFLKAAYEQASGNSSYNGYPMRTSQARTEALLRSLNPAYSKVKGATKNSPLKSILGFNDYSEKPAGAAPARKKAPWEK